LIVKFAVDFPESLDPHVVNKLEALLPPKVEPMIPDEHDEVNLSEFDPEANRRFPGSHDLDDDEGPGHGPGVSCATQ
jgi:hypothetical protein